MGCCEDETSVGRFISVEGNPGVELLAGVPGFAEVELDTICSLPPIKVGCIDNEPERLADDGKAGVFPAGGNKGKEGVEPTDRPGIR